MNEQQAVLDFFAQPDNLPLGLAIAEQLDQQRANLNQTFWVDLQAHLQGLYTAENLLWQIVPTEDRNTADRWVGLHALPAQPSAQYLHPILEQQLLGEQLRIYLGVMWHVAPTPEQLALPAVMALSEALAAQGFKQNERFLGWQWTLWHPRRRDFLLRYTQQPAALLSEVAQRWHTLLSPALAAANTELAPLPASSLIRFGKSA